MCFFLNMSSMITHKLTYINWLVSCHDYYLKQDQLIVQYPAMIVTHCQGEYKMLHINTFVFKFNFYPKTFYIIDL